MMTIRRSICDAALCRGCRGVLGRIVALVLLIGTTLPAAGQVDPRAPGAIALLELGRLDGSLKCVTAMNESFGRQIYSIGDVDGDSLNDWIVTHRRCDTSFSGYAIIELLIYHGMRGGLPPASAGIRLGPSEIDADCSFIGSGDYDGDGHRDIAISQRILGDPFTLGALASSIVVFWNNGDGRFSVDDTTHLTGPTERIIIMEVTDLELSARVPTVCDLDQDGAQDLVVAAYAFRAIDRVVQGAPRLSVFRGRRGHRWGRNGAPGVADWSFWQAPYTRRVSVLDHDGDGLLDIAMYVDPEAIGSRGWMSVAYGRRGALPDTIPERIDFARVDGHDGKQGQLIDVTGDRVPELIVSTGDTPNGSSWRWLVYVGRRGQRLLDQYGSGNDLPKPGDSLWWGRPWTEVWTPRHYNSSWGSPSYSILDPGDIGLDGIGDFCAGSYPVIVCYNGGSRFDSWIDAWLNIWPAGDHQQHIARLGDIDGSGRDAIGVPWGGGDVRFYTPSRDVPRGGDPIRLPEGSDRPVSAPLSDSASAASLRLTIAPNPATAQARLIWSSDHGSTALALLDLRGRELRRWLLPAGVNELTINLSGLPAGIYLVNLRDGERSVLVPLLHVDARHP